MKIISYARVSTKKQANSGLGLEAQRTAIEGYRVANNGQIIGEYVEQESGSKSDRPQLMRAIGHARATRAVLAVAVLDRLSRNSLFINQLLDSGVDFVDCQSPSDSPLVIRIKAAIAQEELEKISQRTKAALAAAKSRGIKLGSARPNHWLGREQERLDGLKQAQKQSVIARKKLAAESYQFLLPSILDQRALGHSYLDISNWLNEQGHTTRHGNKWSDIAVMRLIERAK